MKTVCILIFIFSSSCILKAQEFLNGDLSGIIQGPANLPFNWYLIPYTDVNCLATVGGYDTPDLTSVSLPVPWSGIIGNPYSGATFVSGVHGFTGSHFYQEGIKQTVSGFVPGNLYRINFHQAVVKQINLLDSSGSWAVYIDTTLAGITTPTVSTAIYNSLSFNWELRIVSFIATNPTHIIKFLPLDDDTLFAVPFGLRMGIDCIFLFDGCDSTNSITGDENIVSNKILNVYPNPFTNSINVNIDYFNPGLNILIYDIYSKLLINSRFKNSITVNTEHLAKGIYYYEVRNNYSLIKNGKIIKE
ncbi:MAG: T9SS type A sorting domain-containing protein [Bacteroidota bacterium]|nr:T9SS type A sorting domain-containing protein [Bacteroidota bacterium]